MSSKPKPKLTDWFDCTGPNQRDPWEPGLYEVRGTIVHPDDEPAFVYWDEDWPMDYGWDGDQWRGLSEAPSKKG